MSRKFQLNIIKKIKKKLKKNACERYQNLRDKTEKKQQYVREQYKSLPEK